MEALLVLFTVMQRLKVLLDENSPEISLLWVSSSTSLWGLKMNLSLSMIVIDVGP